MNLGQIATLIAAGGEAVTEIAVDAGELESGGTVLVPLEPQIGTTQGQPVYLVMYLSTTKQHPQLLSPTLTPPPSAIEHNQS